MKASVIAASLVSLLALTPAVALADPTELNINVFCPDTSGSSNVLANYGDYIAGYGQEVIEGIGGKRIYFKSTTQLADKTPKDLSQYKNEKAEYDSTAGRVTCTYGANSNPEVKVSYTLTNGIGGSVISQSYNSVSISLPLGLRA